MTSEILKEFGFEQRYDMSGYTRKDYPNDDFYIDMGYIEPFMVVYSGDDLVFEGMVETKEELKVLLKMLEIEVQTDGNTSKT